MKDRIASELAQKVVGDSRGSIGKKRVYVDDPSDIPEGYESQEGPQGGTYYETDGEGSSSESDSSAPSDWESEFEVEESEDEYHYELMADDSEIQVSMGIPKDGEAAEMYHLWIDESKRGQGVGQEVMEAAENIAEEHGMEYFNAVIGGDKDIADSFFTSLGYESGWYEDGEVIPEETTEWSQFTKPLDGEEESESGDSFYHGTNAEGAKNLVENGINENLLQSRDSGFFGEGFYVAAKESTAQDYADSSSGEGSGTVEVQLESNAEVLNVDDIMGTEDGHQGLVPREPPEWHDEFLGWYEGVLEEAAVWEKIPGKEREDIVNEETFGKMTPGHENFQREDWYENVTNFATDEGFGAVHFVDSEIIVTDPDQVESIDYADGEKSKAPTFLDTQEVFVVVDPPEMDFSEVRDEEDTKEAILKEMGVGMFAALASETPAPTVEEVDEDYNEVEGETPDGETAEGDINRVSKARVYVESPEQVPEGFEPQEGQQGGIYYEPDEAEEDFTQDEWEQAGLQILEDFDEDDYRWDYWDYPDDEEDLNPGTIVHISDEMFTTYGDTEGPRGVIVDADPESGEFAVVTEEGDMVLAEDINSLLNGEADMGITAAWDNLDQDNIRTGWDDDFVSEEEQREQEQQEQQRQQEIESGERAPEWADEDPFKDVTDSDAPEGGLEEGELYFFDDEVIELERDEEYEGDVPAYETENFSVSSIDGILCRVGNPNDINEGEVQYFDFADDVDMPDGWYQVGDLDEGEDGELGWELWNSEEGIVELGASNVFDEVEGVHRPRENSYKMPGLENTPEPSGSKNPDDWTIDWESTDDEKTGNNLPMAQKKLLMREWESAVDSEAAESISNTIRDIKDGTFNTQGQKYDRLIKAMMGAEGEPRSGDFEDAEEPTEEEIEAMKVLQDASQKFFETHYGDSKEIHRGLAEYSHKDVLPQLREAFKSEGGLSGKEIQLEDNPAGTWTTEAGTARAFTVAGSGMKSLKVKDTVEKENVFNMPDAIYPYESRFEGAKVDSDWDEGELNTPSNGKRISADDIEISNIHDLDDEGRPAIASLTDALHNPESVLDSGDTGAINRFLKTLDDMDEEFYEAYKESLQSNEAVTNHEEWEEIEQQINSIEHEPGASIFAQSVSKQEGDVITIDMGQEAGSNWLNTTTEYVLSQEQEEEGEEEKARRYVNDPSEAPEGVEVEEGPRGGYYYEDEAQTEIDDFTDTIADPEEEEDEEIPGFYDAEINDYVLDFMEQEGIETLSVPENPDFDEVKDAENTWQEAMDYLSDHKDEMDDIEDGMAVVSFAAERRDEMRRRRNEDNSPDRDVPETPDPVTYDEIQESYDFDQVPDTVPDELDEMYAVADMSESYRQFTNSVLQNGLLDISNRQLHRFGRAFSSDEEFEVDDLTTLPEDELSALAQGDLGQETMRRIQEAREGDDGSITMYRAVPEFVDDTGIGDYVALNPEYAQRHGEKVLGAQQDEAWHVLEEEVPIEDVVWPGEVASEFVYSPKEYRERWSSLKEFYQEANSDDAKAKILKAIESLTKERVYVDDASQAPEGVQVQEGEQGGTYYNTEDLEGTQEEPDEDSINEAAKQVANSIAERIDWDDRDSDIHDRQTSLSISEEQKGRLKEEMENELGEEPVEEFYSAISEWKSDSDKPGAGRHLAALKEAIGSEGEFDTFVIDQDPTRDHIQVAKVAHELSKYYWENEVDEDTLHRGVTEQGYGKLIDQWLKSDSLDEITIKENPVNAYTTDERRANVFAEGTGKVRFQPETEDIGAAIDFLFATAKTESEIHVGANGKKISPGNVTMGNNGASLDKPFSDYDMNDHQTMTNTIENVYLGPMAQDVSLDETAMNKLVDWAENAWEMSDDSGSRMAETALKVLEIGENNFGIGPGKPTRDGPEGYGSLEDFEEGTKLRIDTDFEGVQEAEVLEMYGDELILWDDQQNEYVIDDLSDVVEVLE